MAAPAGELPDLWLLGSFGIGAVLLRGAGCTINDWWDWKIDRLVERSKTRPIASGEVSRGEAVGLAAAQCLAGLPILVSLNTYSMVLGAASLIPVTLYPLAKRVSNWPQAVLGLTMNWGALLGWSAIHGHIDPPAVALYVGAWAWTLVYDTIYAHQDKLDDAKLKVGSTALRFGNRTRTWLTGFTVIFLTATTTAGILVDQSLPYYAAVFLSSGHLLGQVHGTDLNNPKECLRAFQSNTNVALVLFSGIVVGNLLRS